MGQLELFVPDRFDMLQRRATDQLGNIVVPVEDALTRFDAVQQDLKAAGRGGFLLLRGDSGSGKSTFLQTLGLFRENVATAIVPRDADMAAVFRGLTRTDQDLRILVVDGREALRDVGREELEASVHEINGFIRQQRGELTLVVWPCNADDLQELLLEICKRVGGDALLGVADPMFRFLGPRKDQYLDIATRTIATLNEGASLFDLGISDERAAELRDEASTIGMFLGLLRQDLLKNQESVSTLIAKERCRVWVVVAAGTEPDGDVDALTRGRLSAADVDRLMAATEANVVKELKEYPEKIGILGAVLDAKILHLPILTALGVVREFADDRLREHMTRRGLSIAPSGSPVERLRDSDLDRAFVQRSLGPRTRGPKPGSNTVEAFTKLVEIASTNDQLLNEALGRALQKVGLIQAFESEKDLGTGLSRRTDLLCHCETGPVRLEMMWRAKTGRADIANYTLTKLQNYGRAIGFLT